MDDSSALARRLRELRKKAGLTQDELAECVGVHLNTISRWENGIDTPKTFKIKRLAEALHVSEADLLNDPQPNGMQLVVSWDWEEMKKGEINMNENKFKLILGDDGKVGLNGAGLITSREAIEEFLSKVRSDLEVAFEAQVKRGLIQEA